ncbi:hypothetical protein BXZ70DRAFT_905241 [Cristinia sonorae]|uniref:Uncharacterized protein n=1 Tax=Cristinia sonorae TaxID=1940300 RepID=A0A8K0UV24_9AGAR|nr:hypothetical protein BXZ70DRAFT_905241 [Cristinia sonorae]
MTLAFHESFSSIFGTPYPARTSDPENPGQPTHAAGRTRSHYPASPRPCRMSVMSNHERFEAEGNFGLLAPPVRNFHSSLASTINGTCTKKQVQDVTVIKVLVSDPGWVGRELHPDSGGTEGRLREEVGIRSSEKSRCGLNVPKRISAAHNKKVTNPDRSTSIMRPRRHHHPSVSEHRTRARGRRYNPHQKTPPRRINTREPATRSNDDIDIDTWNLVVALWVPIPFAFVDQLASYQWCLALYREDAAAHFSEFYLGDITYKDNQGHGPRIRSTSEESERHSIDDSSVFNQTNSHDLPGINVQTGDLGLANPATDQWSYHTSA